MADASGIDLGAIRVLLADEDPVVRERMAEHLRVLNAEPVEAEDGMAAWKLLSDGSFDLAIVDAGLGQFNTCRLIEWMRWTSATRHMPILAVTAREDRDAVRGAFDAGASSFLTKPIDWPTFEHQLGFLLRLSSLGRKERARAQQNAAVSRARDAILGKLCQAVGASASVLTGSVEAIRLAQGAVPSLEIAREANAILSEVRALQRLTSRVGDLAGRLSIEVVAEDRKEPVAGLVERAIAMVRGAAEAACVGIDLGLPGGNVSLMCDGDAMVLGVVQLLRNAIASSPPQVRVQITAQLMPDGVLAITVSDHGSGMDPEFVASCLDPLQAHERGATAHAGGRMGFGLPLARALVEAHNGSLEIRSMPGKGTDAILVLPAERVHRPPGGRDGESTPPVSQQ